MTFGDALMLGGVGCVLLLVGQCTYKDVRDSSGFTSTIRQDVQEAYPKCLITEDINDHQDDSGLFSVACNGTFTPVRVTDEKYQALHADAATVRKYLGDKYPRCFYETYDEEQPQIVYLLCNADTRLVYGRRPLDKTIITEVGK
jgi:hypothetical protein